MGKENNTSQTNREVVASPALVEEYLNLRPGQILKGTPGMTEADFPRVVGKATQPGGRYLDRLTSEERKQHPMCTGFVDYFPDAMAIVSHVSWRGNNKHNPGEELHHARGKSVDHADCIVRHQSTRDWPEDNIPLLHMAEEAWRSMAQLQEAMEQHYGLDLPKGARDVPSD